MFTSCFFVIPNSNATQTVKISEPTHRLFDGVFFNDELAQKLTPTGSLGQVVYLNTFGVNNWLVDPATIDEIIAMSNGYGIADGSAPSGQELAKSWLTQFVKVTKNKKVTPITYGNPSSFWANEIMPDQIEYLNGRSKIRLETLLNRSVQEVGSNEAVKQKFNKVSLSVLKYGQRQIDLLSTVLEKTQLEENQLRLSQLLNPNLEEQLFLDLLKDYDKSISVMRNKLNIKNTKFTVTSSKEELPITVGNDFDQVVKLKLSSRAMNGKVSVAQIKDIELAAKSKNQVLLPIEVFAAGDSRLLVQLTNLENKPVGYPVYINLKLSVISPVTTWITTAAAVLLIIAALVQSVRRVRRRS
ncbi:hypothetical protein B1sIIB91_05910 [Candidatus Nanopelagicus abundans]|uniref:Uncharacterized protein n=1 Tax=Candidatus Nanopelagicus abundans TaxID=1884916 RepID=A0A249L655_9ACTN|nr:hypothetical protein B1sIIB91_05910 [Candidatus Nanopelagicus abundans]